MADTSNLKRLAQAMALIGKIRTAALQPLMEMEDTIDGTPESKATLEALAAHLYSVMPEAKGASNLSRHIAYNQKNDYQDIVFNDLPTIETSLLKWAQGVTEKPEQKFGFEDLLHKVIIASSLPLYRDHHYKQAVWEGYQALFSEIRRRTGRTDDGSDLIGAVFSTKKPLLIAADLQTDTGLNQQKGLLQMLQGAYQAFRNPLAHGGSEMRVTPETAARHLVMISLLVRAIERSKTALA